MSTTLYENRPGGTIVRLADGTHQAVAYGEPYAGSLDPTVLAPATVRNLRAHADETPRMSSEDRELSALRDAARRAALADTNGPNTGQPSVPANYDELDEDTAALLVMNLEQYPERQASLVFHEILFGGNRRKVIDAASERAFMSAQAQVAALHQRALPTPTSAPTGPTASADADARAAAALGAQSLKGDGPDQSQQDGDGDGEAYGFDGKEGVNSPGYWSNADLDRYAAQHQVPDYSASGNREKKLESLRAAGHETPQTPKQQ